ncbi:MAG: hypothetical protein GC151_18910 [Betaproteobacteria bacterium]|nr:hypothetical protein [Betaproteobacteria bacterium]
MKNRTTTELRSPLLEAFEPARLRLLAAGMLHHEERGATVALTAMDHGAGATTVAHGLAHALGVASGDDRVLLVDATSAPDDAHARDWHAVAAQLRDGSEVAAPSADQSFETLSIAGAPAPRSRDDETAWNEAWDRLRRLYGNIIVDCGPLSTESPYLWSKWVDNTILVIDAEKVSRERLLAIRKQIEQGALPVDGFVLNKRRFYVPDRLYRALS